MLEARKEFEGNINIDSLMEELKALCDLENERLATTEEENQITLNVPLSDNTTLLITSMTSIRSHSGISAVCRCSNVKIVRNGGN